jgi:hypothetical protein
MGSLLKLIIIRVLIEPFPKDLTINLFVFSAIHCQSH